MAALLTDSEVGTALSELPGWARDGDAIVKEYALASFPAAIAFVVEVGFLAESANHHPDIDVRWRKVRLVLSTHDSGGLTAKDTALAASIEKVASS